MAETVFFTSDTHFGHQRLLQLGRGRPFATIDEHDEALIERWNGRVQRADRIYHLGDFSFLNKEKTADVVKRLRGHLHVIRGNHDRTLDGRVAQLFESYQHYKEIRVGDQRLILFHFPIASWHQGHKGAWHLHGHCHGNFPDEGVPRLDVGVDCHGFAPISFEEVRDLMAGREWTPPDHHVVQ